MEGYVFPNRSTYRYCKRCGHELDGGEEFCPSCRYNPRERGLRVVMGLILVAAVSMMVLTLPPIPIPIPGRLLVLLAGLCFLLALVVLALSYVATPHRLGRLFDIF
jgi:predicted nucleic acid-binding Zn ribbon protein